MERKMKEEKRYVRLYARETTENRCKCIKIYSFLRDSLGLQLIVIRTKTRFTLNKRSSLLRM